MDPIRAHQLAQKLIPNPKQGIAHDQADRLGITRAQIKQIDHTPNDKTLTQSDLEMALLNNQVDIDPGTGRITRAESHLNFVDSPPGSSSKPGPREDLFSGYSTLGLGDPSKEVNGNRPGSYTPAAGMSLEQLSETLNTPDDVTRLLQPFGSAVYDHDRADKGQGPGGSQSPAYTLENYSGICRDSHQLGAYVLNQNGYQALQIGYKSEGVLHAITAYEGKNGEGFGMIEYGTHYSPEQISEILGRPALSYEEALMAIRPEAKLLNRYSSPEAQKEGYITDLYYTMGNLLYQETLSLSHESHAEWSNNRGVEIEAALGEHWGVKLNVDTGQSPDPTARNAASVAVGYQAGDADDWMRLSVGTQYRPEEGHHSVGGNDWESHPSVVVGAHAEAQWTPFKLQMGDNHQARTTVNGNFTGALGLSQGEGTDGTGKSSGGKWNINPGLSAGLSQANIRLGQHFDGRLSDRFSYQSEAFIAPDILAMTYGYGTGGSGMYSNTGVNASLHYNEGNFGAYVGGQYLFTQVNNLEATGLSTGLSYSAGPLTVKTSAGMLDSNEGWRLQTRQSVNLDITEGINLYGFASQENIFNENHGRVNNPGGTTFGAGLQARF